MGINLHSPPHACFVLSFCQSVSWTICDQIIDCYVDARQPETQVNGTNAEQHATNGEVKEQSQEQEQEQEQAEGQEQQVENVFQLTIRLPHAPVR